MTAEKCCQFYSTWKVDSDLVGCVTNLPKLIKMMDKVILACWLLDIEEVDKLEIVVINLSRMENKYQI